MTTDSTISASSSAAPSPSASLSTCNDNNNTTNTCDVIVDVDARDETPTPSAASDHPLRRWLHSAASRWSLSRSQSTQSEVIPPPPCYDIFLGGSCGNTVWRRELVIPYLKKRSITYYDPQRPVWRESMIHEEQQAKENSKLFLFVLDPGTINATSFIEIAYFAARKAPRLVVVFLGRREWSDKAHPMDLPDRIRTVNLVEAILKRHSVPMLTSINDALDYVDEMIIGEKPWKQAITNPLQRMPFVHTKTKRAIQTTTATIKSAVATFRSSAGKWARGMGLVVAVEIVLVLLVHFFVFSQVPIWLMIVPLLGLDYAALALTVLYLKLKMNRNRNKMSRKLVLNPPNIPRTIAASVTSTAAASSDSSLTASLDLGMNGEMAQLKSFQPQMSIPDYHSGSRCTPPRLLIPNLSLDNIPLQPPAFSDDPLDLVESEVRHHFQQEQPRRSKKQKPSRRERLRLNGCVTSPVGYDVFLSCSSGSELEWITQKAVPQLHKSGLTYTSAIMCDLNMRIPLLHTASHILYYVPSWRTFLSGMIEIAYFIGHSDWQVTVCIPSEAECLVLVDGTERDEETRQAVERRNECYRMAFAYLRDMARRRECRVFRDVEDAIKHISTISRRDNDKKAVLRSLVEKQHLVKEKTQANLLAHHSAVGAAASNLSVDKP